jgi:DNA-binding winged helix-turn-helix (wHTH) protein
MRAAKKAIDEVELDLGRYELRRFGRRIKLEKKPMELLIFLVGRRDQMVSREEIVKKLWRSNLFIDTERNLNNIIRKIRTALGDDSAKPRFLETIVGKGYRFIGPVRVIDAQQRSSNSTRFARFRAAESYRTIFSRGAAAIACRQGHGRSWLVPGICGRFGREIGKSP